MKLIRTVPRPEALRLDRPCPALPAAGGLKKNCACVAPPRRAHLSSFAATSRSRVAILALGLGEILRFQTTRLPLMLPTKKKKKKKKKGGKEKKKKKKKKKNNKKTIGGFIIGLSHYITIASLLSYPAFCYGTFSSFCGNLLAFNRSPPVCFDGSFIGLAQQGFKLCKYPFRSD